MEKKLQRDEHNKMIAGVCAGLAEYLNLDVTLVRVVFVLTIIFHGCGLIPYIVLWIVMPKKIYGFNNRNFNNGPTVDYTVPPQNAGPVDYSVPNAFGGTFNPQTDQPFAMPPKQKSNAGVIVGVALVAFGSFFLLDNFNLLPNWEFDRLWPLVFIVAGIVLVLSRKKEEPWEKEKWDFTEETAPAAAEETETPQTKEDKTEDTPPAV
jgi:phage shock protein C